jgi:hypothetical protein
MGSILAIGADRGGISIMGIGAQKEERRGQEVEREWCPSCFLFLLSLHKKQYSAQLHGWPSCLNLAMGQLCIWAVLVWGPPHL